MREDLYNAVLDYKKNADKDGTFAKLDKESQRYVTKTIEDFVSSGLKLPLEKRQKLMVMQKEMAELEQQAESNLNEDKSKIELSEKDLEKVPKETFEKLEKVKGKPGFRNVHLKHTELALVAKFIENEEARKKIDFAVGNINKGKNVPLIEKLTQMRQEMALLMGYQSFTELTLKDKMAKNPENVEKLLDDLTGRITQKGKKEKMKLTQFKQ